MTKSDDHQHLLLFLQGDNVMFFLSFSGCAETLCEERTCWIEDQFVVTSSSGIRDRDTRVAEIIVWCEGATKDQTWVVGMLTGS